MTLVMFVGENGSQTRFIGVTARECDDALLRLLVQRLVNTGICRYERRTNTMRVNPGMTKAFQQKETELINVVADAGGTRGRVLATLLRWVQSRQR